MTAPATPADPDHDPDVALIMDAYRAFARGDMDAAVVGMHPNVEWIEPESFPNGGRYEGPAAVAHYLRASRDRWQSLVSEPVPYRRSDRILVVHNLHGTLRDGTQASASVADVFTVRSGLIVYMQAYADPADAFACDPSRVVRPPSPAPRGMRWACGPLPEVAPSCPGSRIHVRP